MKRLAVSAVTAALLATSLVACKGGTYDSGCESLGAPAVQLAAFDGRKPKKKHVVVHHVVTHRHVVVHKGHGKKKRKSHYHGDDDC